MPGPPKSGFKPSKEKYKCPVKGCKSEPRGDDIPKHFQNCANLTAPLWVGCPLWRRLYDKSRVFKYDLKCVFIDSICSEAFKKYFFCCLR